MTDLKRVGRRLLQGIARSRPVILLRQRLWNRLRVRRAVAARHPPVLVYQMGKVASKTIMASLARVPGMHTFHAHLLHPHNIEQRRRELEARDVGTLHLHHLGLAIYRGIIVPGHRAKIVTLVREPIGRNISAYFQNLDAYWHVPDAHVQVDFDRLVRGFLEKFEHTRPLTWFDDEFKAVLGIDVYQQSFPQERGFQRIDSEKYQAIILRHDLDDRIKQQCISDFLGIKGFTMIRRNAASAKDYNTVYERFRRTIRLPESYVDQMLESKYARHFFGAAERTRLRKKYLA